MAAVFDGLLLVARQLRETLVKGGGDAELYVTSTRQPAAYI